MEEQNTTCVICGEPTARETHSRRTVHLLGRSMHYRRREFACASCDETFTSDEQGAANERAERIATTRALRDVAGPELKALRELVHVTQAELENVLGLGRNTVARWETEQRPVPAYIKTMIRLLALNPRALLLLREQETTVEEESAFTRTDDSPLSGVVVEERPNEYRSVMASALADVENDDLVDLAGIALRTSFDPAKRWKEAS